MSLKKIINLLLFPLAFFILVFPNSFQAITAVLMLGINFFIFIQYKKILVNKYFIFWWILLSAIFLFYISISDIILQFKFELFLKYIFFPFCWLNIFTYLKQNFRIEYITRILFHFSILAFFSVLGLYVLMLNGYNLVGYFVPDPNINVDFFLGFTLYVYGNLIFFGAGLFVLPDIYKSKIIIFCYILIFIAVALISGRTALQVSFFIGFLLLLFRYARANNFTIILSFVFIFIGGILFLAYFTEYYLNYSLWGYLQQTIVDKVQTGGGVERASQTSVMINKIKEIPWGMGFGNIGIERNAERDFKYEVLILASVIQFGILGVTLIALSLFPVFKTVFYFSKLNNYKIFYLAGLLAIITFSFTNPYLESFCFQWMYIGPLVFLSDFKDEQYRWSEKI